jgi:hypothetical protein
MRGDIFWEKRQSGKALKISKVTATLTETLHSKRYALQ